MLDEIKDRMYDDGPIQPVGTPGFHSGYLQALHDRNWLLSQVDRLREAGERIKRDYHNYLHATETAWYGVDERSIDSGDAEAALVRIVDAALVTDDDA